MIARFSYNDSNISKMEQIDSNEVSRMKTEIDFLSAKIDDLLEVATSGTGASYTEPAKLTTSQPKQKKWW